MNSNLYHSQDSVYTMDFRSQTNGHLLSKLFINQRHSSLSVDRCLTLLLSCRHKQLLSSHFTTCHFITVSSLMFVCNYFVYNFVGPLIIFTIMILLRLSHAGTASPRCLDILPSNDRGWLGWRATNHISLNVVSLFYMFGVCVCVCVCVSVCLFVCLSICLLTC